MGKSYQEAQMHLIQVNQEPGVKCMIPLHENLQRLYNIEFSESTSDQWKRLSIEGYRTRMIMEFH